MSKNDYETIKVFPETKVNAKTAAALLSITMAAFIHEAVIEKIERDLSSVLSIDEADTAVTRENK